MYLDKSQIVLPWGNKPAFRVANFRAWVAGKNPEYFSPEVTLAMLEGVSATDLEISWFVEKVRQFFYDEEIPRRNLRQQQFVRLGLFNKSELHSILLGNVSFQPWVLLISEHGGLEDDPSIVPCSSMTNHGVAWVEENGARRTWLVTSRKKTDRVGLDGWDLPSDIGHESAHAAFAPIPLFSQTLNVAAGLTFLQQSCKPSTLSQEAWARFAYIFCELAVVAVRGEERETKTKLPVLGTLSELENFLRLSHELMPKFGFGEALQAVSGKEEISPESDAMYLIGAPVLRVIKHLRTMVNEGKPTQEGWYRNLR